MILQGYLWGILYGVFCLLLALVAYKLGMPKKYTRKLVHILVGFEWLILYHFMGAGLHLLAVCLGFTALLLVSYFAKLLPMISSDGDNSPGTVYYGVAMSAMALCCVFFENMMLPFGIAVFATSLGDGLAGVLGQAITRHNPKIYREKTLIGFLSNLVICFAVALTMSSVFTIGLRWWQCAAIALVAAGVELISTRGLDNIFLPASVFLLSTFLIEFADASSYLIPIILTPYVLAAVNATKALTGAATVAALFLDVTVSVALGNMGFIILFIFLFGSVIIDKFKKKYRRDILKEEVKGSGGRDVMQVLANGGVPFLVAAFYILRNSHLLIVAYVAAVAEAFADTAASGVGIFAPGAFDLFRMKKCKKGMSGGMSWLGTAAALIAAVLVALVAFLFGKITAIELAIAAAAAFIGAIVDSALGSLLQVKYRCPVCGELTEKETHCQVSTSRVSGIPLVDNDVVNAASSASAAIIASIIYLLIV